MTPAEIAAVLAARGWAQVGTPLKATLFRHTTHQSRQPLLVVSDNGEVRVFREVHPERLPMILAGGGPPR